MQVLYATTARVTSHTPLFVTVEPPRPDIFLDCIKHCRFRLVSRRRFNFWCAWSACVVLPLVFPVASWYHHTVMTGAIQYIYILWFLARSLATGCDCNTPLKA